MKNTKSVILVAAALGLFPVSLPAATDIEEEFLPQSPITDYLESENGVDPAFCAEWNPEYVFRGHRCCARPPVKRKKRRMTWCSPSRVKVNFCDEMTDEQREYSERGYAGQLGDILRLIDVETGKHGPQSNCTVNNGFLAWGRRVVPTAQNRIRLRTPARCVDFGTDEMVGMLEWVGRQINSQYSDPSYSHVHLLVGDVAAPRGGCLSGRGGRRGHSSHTSGLDVDLGFLSAREGGRSPDGFVKEFDARTNWWFLKKVFQNPYACIKVIFLDRKLISKLARVAGGDPLWNEYHRFIRHVKGHKNHFHVRVGNHAGAPGCDLNANPDAEAEEENAADINSEELVEIFHNTQAAPTRQTASVPAASGAKIQKSAK